jgi:hypothetical protein
VSDPVRPLCAAIRAKGFYVYTEEAPPPEETQTAVFWCVKTLTSVGPDNDAVHRDCCDGTRPCFEGPKP